MARPLKCKKVCSMPKCKKVCSMPKCKKFIALENACNKEIIMGVDEYEAIRLVDYRGFTQEEAAKKMNIARTTLQKIYEEARVKISQVIVDRDNLIIDGGAYTLCDGEEEYCNCGGCKKHREQNKGDIKNESSCNI